MSYVIIFSENWKTKSQNIYKSYSVKAEFLIRFKIFKIQNSIFLPCWSANWTGLLILRLFLVISSLISSSFSTRSSLKYLNLNKKIKLLFLLIIIIIRVHVSVCFQSKVLLETGSNHWLETRLQPVDKSYKCFMIKYYWIKTNNTNNKKIPWI